jgi:hypothetical protein
MPWWPFLLGLGLALITTYAIRPKTQTRPPAGLNEIDVPTAEEGREMPVLFGCRELRGPNVVWYGDLNTVPIKTKGRGKK